MCFGKDKVFKLSSKAFIVFNKQEKRLKNKYGYTNLEELNSQSCNERQKPMAIMEYIDAAKRRRKELGSNVYGSIKVLSIYAQ